jgi:hypothetical protein
MHRLISTLRNERVRFVGFLAGLGALLAVFGAFVLPHTAQTTLPDTRSGEAPRATLVSNEQDGSGGCPWKDRSSKAIEVATLA